MTRKLEPLERDQALSGVPDWSYDAAKDAISRQFRFKDFSEAFSFMTRVALLAEKAGHHPNWSNSFAKVWISLSTHDAGGLSDKDIALATAIDVLVA